MGRPTTGNAMGIHLFCRVLTSIAIPADPWPRVINLANGGGFGGRFGGGFGCFRRQREEGKR